MERKLNSIWKKQLLCCVAVFFAGLLAGYLLHNGVPVILGSDAHISFSIADYGYLYPLLEETQFPDELIMNYDTERFLTYLGIH